MCINMFKKMKATNTKKHFRTNGLLGKELVNYAERREKLHCS